MRVVAKVLTGSSAGFYFGPSSLLKLKPLHPDLRAVVKYALHISETLDFTVVCGMRTLARQRELFAHRATRTMDSRHLTGHAVDLAPWVGGKVCWAVDAFPPLVTLMKRAANVLQIPLRCGADFNNEGTTGDGWRDWPHFELPKAEYHHSDMTRHSEMGRLWS